MKKKKKLVGVSTLSFLSLFFLVFPGKSGKLSKEFLQKTLVFKGRALFYQGKSWKNTPFYQGFLAWHSFKQGFSLLNPVKVLIAQLLFYQGKIYQGKWL